jgi:hypothetical protein
VKNAFRDGRTQHAIGKPGLTTSFAAPWPWRRSTLRLDEAPQQTDGRDLIRLVLFRKQWIALYVGIMHALFYFNAARNGWSKRLF